MNRIVNKLKKEYSFRTFINSTGSFAVTFVFALYNGFLGIWYSSVWNAGICIYYFFLVLIRGKILLTEKRNLAREKTEADKYRTKTFSGTAKILLLMSFALIIPVLLMVYNERPVNMGLIPAIAVASYTTYKVVMASINIKRMRKSRNILVIELHTINFIDALVSVLTLQNTLIIVGGDGGSYNMFVLSSISSFIILSAVIIISVMLVSYQNRIKRK